MPILKRDSSLESWQDQLSVLSGVQQRRIESPEFFELLRREITKRFLPLIPDN
jgi:hypothetical protein